MPPKDKKDKKAGGGGGFDPFETIVFWIVILALASSIVPALIRYVTSGEISFYGFQLKTLLEFINDNLFFFKTLGFTIAGVAAAGTLILVKSGDAVLREERAKLYPANMPDEVAVEPITNHLNERWQTVVAHSESTNPSDWRFAIIEADILLEELLDQMRLPGDTIGDKLKAVEPSDFLTINAAWEAHKARNMIAHEGSNFLLNQHETRRIVALYASVFKEFGLI